MPTFSTTLHSPAELETVWNHLHDFTSAAHWDPSVARAETLTPGPVGVGSRHRLHVRFLGRETPLDYEVVELSPHRLVRLRADNALVSSEDTITFEATATGTRVHYDARLRPRGVARLARPLLALAFGRLASAAEEGLAAYLGALVPADAAPRLTALDGGAA